MRLDYVAQLAGAHGSGQIFEGWLFDAKLYGQSAAFMANQVPCWMVLVASK